MLCAQVDLATKGPSNTVWPQFVGLNRTQSKALRLPYPLFWRARATFDQFLLIFRTEICSFIHENKPQRHVHYFAHRRIPILALCKGTNSLTSTRRAIITSNDLSDCYVTSTAIAVLNTPSAKCLVATVEIKPRVDKVFLVLDLSLLSFIFVFKCVCCVDLACHLQSPVWRLSPPPHPASCDRSNPQTNRVRLCLWLAGGGASLRHSSL